MFIKNEDKFIYDLQERKRKLKQEYDQIYLARKYTTPITHESKPYSPIQ